MLSEAQRWITGGSFEFGGSSLLGVRSWLFTGDLWRGFDGEEDPLHNAESSKGLNLLIFPLFFVLRWDFRYWLGIMERAILFLWLNFRLLIIIQVLNGFGGYGCECLKISYGYCGCFGEFLNWCFGILSNGWYFKIVDANCYFSYSWHYWWRKLGNMLDAAIPQQSCKTLRLCQNSNFKGIIMITISNFTLKAKCKVSQLK